MAGEQVHVSVDSRTEWTSVKVVGVMDAASLVEVAKALTDAVRDTAAVYVDLDGVTFMDSRGLGALLAANERSRDGGSAFAIYRPSEAVRRLLDVAGVRRVFDEVDQLPS